MTATVSYLRARLVSVKLHPLWSRAGETGCGCRRCTPSNRRKGDARGEEGKDGEEAKGEGGETRGDGSLWPSRPGPWVLLSPLCGEEDCSRFWGQTLESWSAMEKGSQRGLPAWGTGLPSSSFCCGERYLISASSTWSREVDKVKGKHSTFALPHRCV